MSHLLLRAMKLWPSLLVFVGALTALAPKAEASISVCNRTSAFLIFDFARTNLACSPTHYADYGWYGINVNQCIQVYDQDATNINWYWTAEQGTSEWGSVQTGTIFRIPNSAHSDLCFDTMESQCNSSGTCRNSYHFYVSGGKPNMTLDIKPNNTYYVN